MSPLAPRADVEPPPSRREQVWAWVGALGGAASVLGVVWLGAGARAAAEAAGWLAASAAGVGKLVILGALNPSTHVSAWTLAAIASVSEIGLSALLLTHLHLLFRIPRLGARLHAVRALSAEYLRSNPRWRRLAGVGVAIYTALPFSGTGPLGSTFFGEMAGLTRRTVLLGIAAGSVISSGLMAWGVVALAGRMEALLRHPAMMAGGVVLALGLLGWVGRAMRRVPVDGRPAGGAGDETEAGRK